MANLETWLAEQASIIQKPDTEKQPYMYDWLERLDQHLKSGTASNEEIKKCQPKIVVVLHQLIKINCCPATRQQLAKCFATLYAAGTTMGLFDSVNTCIDVIKSKDDSVGFLPVKLTAISCLGAIFEKLGRMVATLYDEGYLTLLKLLTKSEPPAKCEILLCFQKMVVGLSSSASSGFKDIYKACKSGLIDKSMPVRWAAAKCALELSRHAPFMCTIELETMVNMCFRALDGSNYDVRVQVATLIGTLMALSQQPGGMGDGSKTKKITIEEMFAIMASGFLRGSSTFGSDLLKGANVSRELRVGVTQAYVCLFREMGSKWVTKYIAPIIIHTLELVASPRAVPNHIDAVYSRKCISFILNIILSGMLPESSQVQAVKELCKIISKQMDNIHALVTAEHAEENASNPDVIMTQHVLVCALEELSNLVLALTSSLKSIMEKVIVEAVFSTLIHPAPAVWLSAAWCIRCCAIAIPSFLTQLIGACVDKMGKMRASPEAVTGYGYTLAAIIGGMYKCPLGIPYTKAKGLFTLTDELLQSAGQSGKLALCKIQTGWVMLGALCSLGASIVKNWVSQMIQLWSSAFPMNAKDLDGEKNRGNVTSWQLCLENRAGALCSMSSFLVHCKDLIHPELVKKILIPVEMALAFFPMIPSVIKVHGAILKPCAAMFKVRLYTLLSHLQPKLYEGSFTPLLRELVAEFTLADHRGSTTTSMLQSLCHPDDSILLGSWLQETDHKLVEEQLLSNSASGSGALEHDSSSVYARANEHQNIPGPLPLGVTVIDSAINLFGHVFPFVAQKHRSQLMEHFIDCIAKTKGARQQAIQTNIFTAFLAALKNLAETKTGFGESTVRKAATALVQDALANPDNILRCAAGEALGRMAQVVNDPDLVAQTAQKSFEMCQKTTDAVVRTGHSLALGCLHRYVGGMGSGQHLSNSVSILIALAKDASSNIVQVWALHGLTLIADSGGPMFRSFVEQSLHTVIDLMLRTPRSLTDLHQCMGKCMGALITAIGPELQDSSKAMERTRMFCMQSCSIMSDHPDSQVQAEAVRCLQQLHLFAPNFVNLTTLVPHLCSLLLSPHLLLRRGSVACLRQLAHREAGEICEQGMKVIQDSEEVKKRMFIAEKGLEGVLFCLLDSEIEADLQKHIRETLTSLLQTLVVDNLGHWLALCKQVLLASKAEELSNDENSSEKDKNKNNGDDDDDDEAMEQQIVSSKGDDKPNMTPKWPTRVFAMECARMMLQVCRGHKKHMDLQYARELKTSDKKKSDFLVMQLAELVRMAFIAGTSSNELLKLEGMNALQDVVLLFARVPDPDISGQVILEQFQAQVGTALRPAFEKSVPPDITAMACEVCSSWIGCGISRDINDVRRIQQLLVHSLKKISASKEESAPIYNESAYTLETLAVLKAWAQIYIMTVKHDRGSSGTPEPEVDHAAGGGSILELVEADLPLLVKYWIGAIRDCVLLMLPLQYAPQLPVEGGSFYSGDSCDAVRPLYKKSWPPMVHAVALWLSNYAFRDESKVFVGASDESLSHSADGISSTKALHAVNKDRFHLVVGVAAEAMCAPLSTYPEGTVETCVQAVATLLETEFGRVMISGKKAFIIELLTVLHRVLLTSDDFDAQLNILNVVSKCSLAFRERILRGPAHLSEASSDVGALDDGTSLDECDEGEIWDTVIQSKTSVVFSLLQTCLCVVSKHAASVMPAETPRLTSRKQELCSQSISLLAIVAQTLADIPSMCSPAACIAALPSVMFLCTGVFKYICMEIRPSSAHVVNGLRDEVPKIIRAFKSLLTCDHASDEGIKGKWDELMQSGLVTILQIPALCCKCDATTPLTSPVTMVWENILLTLSVFLLHSPSISDGSATDLVMDCVKVFAYCIDEGSPKVCHQAVKLLEPLIRCPVKEISLPFIRECVPRIVGMLELTQGKRPESDVELSICKDGIRLLEYVLQLVEETHRSSVMSIYISTVVNLLHDPASPLKANSFSLALHEFCMQHITDTAPLFPAVFRATMQSLPALKARLESAVKSEKATKTARSSSVGKVAAPALPQIQLKMDFSNFR